MGYFQAFMLIGQSAGPVFGGWAAAIWDLRAPFYVYSVMGLLTVIFTYFLIHEPKWIVRKLGEEHFPKANDAKRLLKNTTFAVASIATFIVFFQRSGVKTNLLPIYATDELSMDSAAIGTILGYSTIAQLLITVPAGYAIDLLGRKPVIISNLILMAAANLAFVYAKDYWSVSLAAVVLGLASGGAGQAPLALATDATYHERRGLSMGFYRLVGDVGGMLGPVMLSSIADFYGLHLPFWVMTGMLIMSALIILVFAKEIIDVKENRAKVLNKRGLLS
jgi:MFS family permease